MASSKPESNLFGFSSISSFRFWFDILGIGLVQSVGFRTCHNTARPNLVANGFHSNMGLVLGDFRVMVYSFLRFKKEEEEDA